MRMRTHLTADSASCGKRVTRLPGAETGIALLALVLLLFLTGVAVYLSNVSATSIQLQRQQVTLTALAQAKEALIGYAVSPQLSPSGAARPGDLPCPDLNDDGQAETSCGSAAGSQQARRLGRLPWKTLGLPDLRDGHGERLWYAVSNQFKKNTRSPQLNSDSRGTITVRDSSGAISHDGTNPSVYLPSGAIVGIFSPGAVLQRQGAGAPQDRSCGSDTTCQSTGVCASIATPNPTPKCNPLNYLDTALGEDNADFVDSNSNGFIQGVIKDAAGNAIVNDTLAIVTYQELMPLMEKRVVGEVRACFDSYGAANSGRYPWAAPLNPAAAPAYNDTANIRFGRVPGTQFTGTNGTNPSMSLNWTTASCNIASTSGWWFSNNWKEIIFYGIAAAYAPDAPGPLGCGSPLTCLTVNPPSSLADKQFVVFAAGTRLNIGAGQPRSTNAQKADITNYLEGQNASIDDVFETRPVSGSFNDQASYR